MDTNSDYNEQKWQRRSRMIHLIWATLLVLVLVAAFFMTRSGGGQSDMDAKELSEKYNMLSARLDQLGEQKPAAQNSDAIQDTWRKELDKLSDEIGKVKRTVNNRLAGVDKDIGGHQKRLGWMYRQINQLKQEKNRMSQMDGASQRNDTDPADYDNLYGKLESHNRKLENIDTNVLSAIDGISQIQEVLSQVVVYQQPKEVKTTEVDPAQIDP